MAGMYGGAEIPIPGNEELIFGRDAGVSHVVFSKGSEKISRKHMSVYIDQASGDYVVTDFSSNGTFLSNGTRLKANTPTRIRPGATIYLANRENSFRLGSDDLYDDFDTGSYMAEGEGGIYAGDIGGLSARGGGGFFDRYEEGGLVLFVCLAGIITAIIALCTFSGEWVSIEWMFISESLTLPQISDLTNQMSGFAGIYDSGTASTLGLISLAASVSYWVLLIGAIISLIVCGLMLIWPPAEILFFIPSFIVIAFAVIGGAFTLIPLFTDWLGVMPIPVIMLVVSGVPAFILRGL